MDKLIVCYRRTLDDFNSLANFVVASQENIFKEISKFKRHSNSKLVQSAKVTTATNEIQ